MTQHIINTTKTALSHDRAVKRLENFININGERLGTIWTHFDTNPSFKSFFVMDSLKCCPGDIMMVWTKTVYSKKGVASTVKSLGKKYKNLKYSQSLDRIDCKNSKNQILIIGDYEKDGSVISTFDFQNSDWKTILPDTITAKLQEIICRFCNLNSSPTVIIDGEPTPEK